MLHRLIRDRSGTAGVEMALITPLLMILMFGSMELGFYFYSEHVVVKAVRDGARFASRNGFDKFSCSDPANGTVDATVEANTQRVTRTDQVATGGSARIRGWTDDSTVLVGVRCDTSGTYASIYDGLTDSAGNAVVPVVTVSATVPYLPLFARIGFDATALQLTAKSEAPVMGV